MLLSKLLMTGAAAVLLTVGVVPSATAADKKPSVVFVTGDHEYRSELTMPLLAHELESRYGMKVTVLKAFPDEQFEENIPGLEALDTADMAIFFLRWRRLPDDQLKHIKAYLEAGKPVMGFRTTSHAFNFPKGHASESWNAFGESAFGTPPGWGASGHTHYGHLSSTDVAINPAVAQHPILKGVEPKWHVRSWLYHVVPQYPPADATLLLMGTAVDPDKAAKVNPVAWTWKNKYGGRAFYTSMGHPDDFKVESFQRMLVNAVFWGLDQPVPETWAGKMDINVPYEREKKK